jgi:hypothetical protein
VTASWQGLQTAPRDGREVWLFLPAAAYKIAAEGTVSDVKHAAVVAAYDKARGAWIARDGGRDVYPSLWSDADVDGVMPDNPLLTAHAAR